MLWLIRHGETEWSLSGAHTGRTDLPLTPQGEEKASAIREKLRGREFGLVLASPLQRAVKTCEIAGYGEIAEIEPNLMEWDYGDFEGRTTADIQRDIPGWDLFRDGVPNGESLEQVAQRARLVIDRSLRTGGDTALFGHGHMFRILASCWLGLPPNSARLFALATGSVSKLGYERETRIISQWNA